MREFKETKVFPFDCDTLWVISEIENFFGLKSRDTDKISYIELVKYIDELALMLLKRKV